MAGCWLYLCAVLSIAALTVSAGPPAGAPEDEYPQVKGCAGCGRMWILEELSVRKKRILTKIHVPSRWLENLRCSIAIL
ncbi:UNVERIFIED_CONTAM: hypothetical protein FKN15_059436 [Acipenser sinensis]